MSDKYITELEVFRAYQNIEYEKKMLELAIEFVREKNFVSVSAVQRNFEISYNRAYGIIEKMEHQEIISKADESGKRHVIKFIAA